MPTGTYTIVNSRPHNTTIDFNYARNIIPDGGVVQLGMIPGGQYSITFNLGTSGTATLRQGKFQGHPGSLVMGDAPFAAQPGRYVIV